MAAALASSLPPSVYPIHHSLHSESTATQSTAFTQTSQRREQLRPQHAALRRPRPGTRPHRTVPATPPCPHPLDPQPRPLAMRRGTSRYWPSCLGGAGWGWASSCCCWPAAAWSARAPWCSCAGDRATHPWNRSLVASKPMASSLATPTRSARQTHSLILRIRPPLVQVTSRLVRIPACLA